MAVVPLYAKLCLGVAHFGSAAQSLVFAVGWQVRITQCGVTTFPILSANSRCFPHIDLEASFTNVEAEAQRDERTCGRSQNLDRFGI